MAITSPHIDIPPAMSALYALCLCLELLLLGGVLLDTIYKDGFYFSGSQLVLHLGVSAVCLCQRSWPALYWQQLRQCNQLAAPTGNLLPANLSMHSFGVVSYQTWMRP